MRLTLGTLNHSISLRTGLALTAAAGLAASGLAMASSADAATTHGLRTAHSCAASTKAGFMSCQAVKVTSGVSSLAKSSGAVDPKAAPSGYGPSDLQSAYSLPSSGGSGETVAIVDAYDNPNAESDLATYRSSTGCRACTTANGCFSKVGQDGSGSLPTADSGWAEEESLDVDMVSAVCPQLPHPAGRGEQHVHGRPGRRRSTPPCRWARGTSPTATAAASPPTDTQLRRQYFDHPGVVITVAPATRASAWSTRPRRSS